MPQLLPRPPRQERECKLCKRIRWFIIVAVAIIVIARTNPEGLRAVSFITTDNVANLIMILLGFTVVFKGVHWYFVGRYDAQDTLADEQENWDKKQKSRERRMGERLAKQKELADNKGDEEHVTPLKQDTKKS